jgi:hypothetical protein
MSTAAVSSSSIYQELQSYFQQRQGDLQQLGKALQSGDLAGAQQEFSAIQTLAQSGPFAQGNAFKVSQRQQDFAAVGQALQSGDLAGAQQAFAQLQATFNHQFRVDPQTPSVPTTGGPASPSGGAPATPVAAPLPPASSGPSVAGPEIILNLGNTSPGEEITIGVNSGANGAEQLTVSVANQQNQNPEQITINLNQNSNEQIILNLFNSATQNSTQGSGVNVTA